MPLTEIGDIHRFRNERQFASYLGLVPTSHSSGEKTSHGEMTFRGNKRLGPLLVESALVAIRQDRALAAAYREYCKRMLPQEAIIRITRKLSNRILIILKSGKSMSMTDVTDRKYKRALQANFNRDDSCINYDEPSRLHL